jgi:hypothetical protein
VVLDSQCMGAALALSQCDGMFCLLIAGTSAAASDQASAADAARAAAEREAVERAYVQVTATLTGTAEYCTEPAM